MGVNDSWIKNDGFDWLWNSGGTILLNTQGGVFTEGDHHRAALVTKPRPLRIEDVEFTFWITATVIYNCFVKYGIQCYLLAETRIFPKIKSSLLVETKWHKHFKADLVKNIDELKYGLIKEGKKFTYKLESRTTIKTIKKVLLKRIKDIMGDED